MLCNKDSVFSAAQVNEAFQDSFFFSFFAVFVVDSVESSHQQQQGYHLLFSPQLC